MKHTLAFFTSSRSDMTIFEPLLSLIKKNNKFNYQLFVHGTHLEKKYGNTINEIKKLNFKITSKFKTISRSDNFFGQTETLILSVPTSCHRADIQLVPTFSRSDGSEFHKRTCR